MEVIKIKCPWCNAVLTVRDNLDNEGKSVTCPICKKNALYSQFKRVDIAPQIDEGCTQYAVSQNIQNNEEIGVLKSTKSGQSFQLKLGKNIIGRKAANSSASIQIDTNGDKRMSREHIIIEVVKHPIKGTIYSVSLYKEKVNDTTVAGQKLIYGDCIIIHSGDTIELPNYSLIFEIPDAEATQI